MANPLIIYRRKLVPHDAKTFHIGDPAMSVYVDDKKFAGYLVKVTRRFNGKSRGKKLYVNVVYTYEKAKK